MYGGANFATPIIVVGLLVGLVVGGGCALVIVWANANYDLKVEVHER